MALLLAKIYFSLKQTMCLARQELLELLVACVEVYGFVIEQAMGDRVGEHFRTACDAYVQAWDMFDKKYEKAFPRRRRGRSVVAPKKFVIGHVLPAFLDRYGIPLTAFSDHPGESAHYDYMGSAENFKIPRSGLEVVAGQRRKTSSSKFGDEAYTPAQQRAAAKLKAGELVGNVEGARLQRLRAVRAWNSLHLPSKRASVDRQKIAAMIAQGKGDEHMEDGLPPWLR